MDNNLLESIRNSFAQNTGKVLFTALMVTIIFAAGLVASHLAKRWLRTLLNHSRIRDDILLKSFFLRTVSFLIFSITLLTALGEIGLDVRTFIAGLGVTGLIIGFALRDTLSNFAAGLLLLTYRPFRAGELIEVEGSQGTVEEMTIVNMQMTSTDGVRIILPNSKVWGAKIINYSLSLRRKAEIALTVRECDMEHAIDTILSAVENDERALKEPKPSIRVASIKNDAASLILSVWTSPQNFSAFNDTAYRSMMKALADNEIQIL